MGIVVGGVFLCMPLMVAEIADDKYNIMILPYNIENETLLFLI